MLGSLPGLRSMLKGPLFHVCHADACAVAIRTSSGKPCGLKRRDRQPSWGKPSPREPATWDGVLGFLLSGRGIARKIRRGDEESGGAMTCTDFPPSSPPVAGHGFSRHVASLKMTRAKPCTFLFAKYICSEVSSRSQVAQTQSSPAALPQPSRRRSCAWRRRRGVRIRDTKDPGGRVGSWRRTPRHRRAFRRRPR